MLGLAGRAQLAAPLWVDGSTGRLRVVVRVAVHEAFVVVLDVLVIMLAMRVYVDGIVMRVSVDMRLLGHVDSKRCAGRATRTLPCSYGASASTSQDRL